MPTQGRWTGQACTTSSCCPSDDIEGWPPRIHCVQVAFGERPQTPCSGRCWPMRRRGRPMCAFDVQSRTVPRRRPCLRHWRRAGWELASPARGSLVLLLACVLFRRARIAFRCGGRDPPWCRRAPTATPRGQRLENQIESDGVSIARRSRRGSNDDVNLEASRRTRRRIPTSHQDISRAISARGLDLAPRSPL